MSDKQAKMMGVAAGDPHKNTATSKKVNDRARRRMKRKERHVLKGAISSGALLSIITRR